MGIRVNDPRNDRPLSLRARILIGIFLSILLILLFVTDRGEPAMGQEVPPQQCQEDEDCWNCETMGNGICGPNAAPTAARPVSGNAHYTG